jgi:iron(III) transport system ATP-binding protein
MTAVEVRNLVKEFKGTRAIDHVSLHIESGEIVCLLGPSGCGKTTTLRCIAGLEQPTSGEIQIGEQLVVSAQGSVPPEKRDIGLVFQSYALWPHMTVFGNVALGLELRKRPKAEIHERVHQALNVLELTGLDHRYPSQLSGGQQQRVALARAIAIEPKVLLFDEPLSNLDAKIRERVRLELHDLLKRLGITSVYVTHDQGEAMAIGDRIVLMNQGKIEQQGDARTLYERPVTRFAADFIGWANFLPVSAGAPNGNGDLSPLDTPDGVRLWSTTAAPSGSGVAAFRPEHGQVLSTDQSGPNIWPITIVKQVYLGSQLETHAQLGQSSIRLMGTDAPVGSELQLHVPPSRVLYFKDSAPNDSRPG